MSHRIFDPFVGSIVSSAFIPRCLSSTTTKVQQQQRHCSTPDANESFEQSQPQPQSGSPLSSVHICNWDKHPFGISQTRKLNPCSRFLSIFCQTLALVFSPRRISSCRNTQPSRTNLTLFRFFENSVL